MKYPVIMACLIMTACSSEPQAEPVEQKAKVEKVSAPKKEEVKEAKIIDANAPLAQQGDNWQYVVNNAIRTADKYAVKNYPKASFISNNIETDLIKQYGGEYKDSYLLKVINDRGDNISFAMLLPLFDVNASSDDLDTEGNLWKIVKAKHNGKEF